MRILLTGGSSFTGCWFARELARRGHELVMTMRGEREAYREVRRQRVEGVLECGRVVFNCAFGDERFMDMIASEQRWDVLCHHAAEARDYKSPEFDIVRALARNTNNLKRVLEALAGRGCRRLVTTGSVFEPGEGAGSDGMPAFSPYGVSKGLTAQLVAFHASEAGMNVGKFVIANPFGPYEERRFTAYLMRTWLQGEQAIVRTPAYVRDNIHVSLLARAYAHFVQSPTAHRLNPSGYVESQEVFARRIAEQMRPRLGVPCEVACAMQHEFPEPRVRINTDPLDSELLGWHESTAWDELAAWYRAQPAALTTPPE